MPNHVHLLMTPAVVLCKLTKSLKGITFKRANAMLALTGSSFWQEETYDHLVRQADEFDNIRSYIEENPVRRPVSVVERGRGDRGVARGPGGPPHRSATTVSTGYARECPACRPANRWPHFHLAHPIDPSLRTDVHDKLARVMASYREEPETRLFLPSILYWESDPKQTSPGDIRYLECFDSVGGDAMVLECGASSAFFYAPPSIGWYLEKLNAKDAKTYLEEKPST
jgi:hypothetical protein